MIKRLKYISRFSRALKQPEIDQIADVSAKNNAALDVTGVFMTSGGLFFQIIEGPAEAVDKLYAKIASDNRHTALVLLGEPELSESRLFGEWAMRKMNRADESADRLGPLVALLDVIGTNAEQTLKLSKVLERGIWREATGTLS